LSEALPLAVAALKRLDAEGQKVREWDLAKALEAAIPDSEAERRLPIPGWDPQPGSVDLFRRNAAGVVLWAAEVKLKNENALFECMWDMAKMVWLATTPGVEDVFIVAGTTEWWWKKPFDSAGLFEDGSQDLVGEIERLRRWWIKYILEDSAGRPTAVPQRILVQPLEAATLLLGGEMWRICLQRISADPEDPRDWVPFKGGLPAGA
jgi:hypothetical protein